MSEINDSLIGRLFGQVFGLRHRRRPEPWEMAIGVALVEGRLRVERPPRVAVLNRIHNVAYDVRLALGREGP